MPNINCVICGKLFYARPSRIKNGKKYCSRECMAEDYSERLRGKNNPNYKNAGYKTCTYCDTVFHNYNKSSQYCSTRCYVKDRNNDYKSCHMTDMNQPFIVDRLRLSGYGVIDCSDMAFGFPDIMVISDSGTYLFEIKNPNTKYYGLTDKQKEWHNNWQGQVDTIEYAEEAIRIMESQ